MSDEKPNVVIEFQEKVAEMKSRVSRVEQIADNIVRQCRNDIHRFYNKLIELESKIANVQKTIANVSNLEAQAEMAIRMVLQKAHDLKAVDKKRDDVINLQNQKLAAFEAKLKE